VSKLLGTRIVATETGTLSQESPWQASPLNSTPVGRTAIVESVRRLVAAAERCDAILALEGYVNNVVATHDHMAEILDRFRSAHLGVVCDPYNYCSRDLLPHARQLTEALFDGFADRFVLAHVKDVAADGAESDTPEVGTGVFDQAHYFGLLRTRRPDLPLILEHLPWDHLPAATKLVRSICGGGAGQ